jgi:hypothetical protein
LSFFTVLLYDVTVKRELSTETKYGTTEGIEGSIFETLLGIETHDN